MQISIYHQQNQSNGFFSKFLILFVAVPLVEIYLLIKIGQRIGALNAVFLVVITGLAGSILMRLEGVRVFRQFQKDLSELKVPQDGLIDGLLILFGGVALITPGVITDICGLLLIIPWSRRFVRGYIKKRLARKFLKNNVIDV